MLARLTATMVVACLSTSPTAMTGGNVHAAMHMGADKNNTPGVITVALLQLSDAEAAASRGAHAATATHAGSRFRRAEAMAAQARSAGADIALLPERWEASRDAAKNYSRLAANLGMAIGATYAFFASAADADADCAAACAAGATGSTRSTRSSGLACPCSALTLFSMDGAHVLTYAVEAGTDPARPTCGRDFKTGTLQTKHGSVVLGAMLGTDYMFFAPARVQMVRGAELLLSSVAAPQGINPASPPFQALAQDNGIFYAHANYANIGGRAAGGSGGGAGAGGAATAANATEQVVVLKFDLAAFRARRAVAGVWSGGMDWLSRKPFQYQPLCYRAAQMAHRAAAGTAGAAPNVPSPARASTGGAAGPVVKVALLQMNAVTVPKGTDPVASHRDRATMFVRLAKKRGADIVVFPEQWSVGYSRNYDKQGWAADPDSWHSIYNGYAKWAQRKDRDFVSHFRALAKELGIAIAAAYTENVDGSTGPGDKLPPRNSVAVIDRHGALVQNFAKVHIAWDGAQDADPEAVTQPGRNFYTHALDLGAGRGNVSVCSMICFDREHPESAALCAAGGAELIIHPTACAMPLSVVAKLQHRALSHGVSIAMANFGNSTDMPAVPWGHSAAINATGHVVALAPDVPVPGAGEPGLEVGEGIFVAEFDLGAQRVWRAGARGHALRDQPLAPELCRIPLAPQYVQGNFDIGRMWL